jgi:hypothetical protein
MERRVRLRAGRIAGRLGTLAALFAAPAACAEDELGERVPIATVLFGSLEAGPAKVFASTGMKQAYGEGGLNASGFRTLTALGISREQPDRRRPRLIHDKVEGQTLIGYEWRISETFLAAYVGPDFEIEQRHCGCTTRITLLRGTRLHADLWSTPTREIMLQASGYATTLGRRLWGRLAPGYAVPIDLPVLRGAYAGPEAEFYRQGDYRKLRLGLHLSGVRLFGLSWRIAAGWQKTSDRKDEAYATLGLHWRRGQEE